MTATDTDALTERLWEAVAEVRDQHPRVFNDAPTDEVVAAVLPIVEAEVRKAKAEAWDEGCEAFESAHKCDHIEPWGHLRDNPYHEAGDSDEPR